MIGWLVNRLVGKHLDELPAYIARLAIEMENARA